MAERKQSAAIRNVVLGENDGGRRLDRVIRKLLPDESLGSLFRHLRRGDIRLNGAKAAPSARVADGDTIEFRGPVASAVSDARSQIDRSQGTAREIERARILFENEHLIILNKRRGELAHGPDSLATEVSARWLRGRSAADGVSFKPGPVHRLDRNTTGIQMFALSTTGAQTASRLFREHGVEKEYVALLAGRIPERVVWNDRLNRDAVRKVTRPAADGKTAHTVVTPLIATAKATLATVAISTGRTHQIRAHAASHGHPLLGDRKYGNPGRTGYLLHAARLRLQEYVTTLGFRTIAAPLPAAWVPVLDSHFPDTWRVAVADLLPAGDL